MTARVPRSVEPSLLVAALLFCTGSMPAFGADKPPVVWTLMPPKVAVRVGSRFSVTLHGSIEPGWHLYALQEPDGGPLPTEVSLAEDGPVRLLRVDQSKPRTITDPIFQLATRYFAENVDFTLHLQSTPTAKRGSDTLHLQVRYQSCNERMCLPPHTDSMEIPLKVRR